MTPTRWVSAALVIAALTALLGQKVPAQSIVGGGGGSFNPANVAITGGSINDTTIGATTPDTGAFTTLSATGLITPASNIGIKATVTNDAAASGSIQECKSPAIVLVGSAVSLTNGVTSNVTSLSLEAGNWEAWGEVWFNKGGSTTTTYSAGGISTVSATLPTAPADDSARTQVSGAETTGTPVRLPVGPVRLSLSGTTTVYLLASSGFAVSTNAAFGILRACRPR